jgi:hypothetical protein
MRKIFILGVLALMTAGLSLGAEFAGYLADLKCANGGKAGAGHEKCAQGCVKGGQPIALVNEADGKVYEIANQDSVKDHVGHKVNIMGKVDGGKLHVDSVKMP